jgi:hypothetical protein
MSANALRRRLIALLAVAAIASVVANKANAAWLGWVAFLLFLVAVVLYLRWRRAALAERRGRVFDREAKTNETGPRPDQ